MPSPLLPNRDDPQVLEVLLQELRGGFTQALMLIEQSLMADPETEASQALAFEAQIGALFRDAEGRMAILREHIAPWDERRRAYPAQLAEEVDKFLELLGKGLGSIQAQMAHRVADLEGRREALRQALDDLNEKRQGVRGYRQAKPRSDRVNRKA